MLAKMMRFLFPLLLTSAVAGGVLAILAPLGTHQFSLIGRFSYWISLCLAGGLGAGVVEYGLRRSEYHLNRWPVALLQSFGATAAVSLFVFQIHHVPNLFSAVMTLFYVWVVAMTICAIGALQRGQSAMQAVARPMPNTEDQAKPPALMGRLKPALRRSEIYALEAQDHYVRVVTSKGEDLILMRLSDAISETKPVIGLSPHRSWWVAEAGVEDVMRRHGKAIIRLKNNEDVPVSRSQLKTLRAQAWL
jgi:hypothetical protein